MTDVHEDLRLRAIALHRSGQLEEAEVIYRKLLELTPEDPQLLELSGILEAQSGRIEAALDRLQRSIDKAPDRASAHENLGNLLQTMGRFKEAVTAYERAVEIQPDSALIRYNLGTAQAALGQHQEALSSYEAAVERDPALDAARQNLANSLRRLGRFAEAEESYRELIRRTPDDADPHLGLAEVLARGDRFEEAAEMYRRVIELDSTRGWLEHFVSAYQGRTTERPPEQYVSKLFDDFAETYDERLMLLDFRPPREIPRLLSNTRPSVRRFRRALDLGCGTGLTGQELRPMVESLSGVDLSANMIAAAGKRGIYDRLHLGDIETFLSACEESFDLVVASDVFSYLGELSAVFEAVRSRVVAGGLFVFTTEVSNSMDYVLQVTGRYAHSKSYIENLSAACGFDLVHHSTEPLRLDFDQMLPGHYFVFGVQ